MADDCIEVMSARSHHNENIYRRAPFYSLFLLVVHCVSVRRVKIVVVAVKRQSAFVNNTSEWSTDRIVKLPKTPSYEGKMIEINAKLVREQKTFFLCGEIVECFISFTHPTLPEHKIAQSNK